MKILINTLTQVEIAAIREQQMKDGVSEKDLFTGTPSIKGQLFIPGEWTHVPDEFSVSGYSYIKEVEVVLADRIKKVLEENNLNQFAQGVKEGNEMYGKLVPSVATDVLKYAPLKVVAVEDVIMGK